MNNQVKIIAYEEGMANYFHDLSKSWLQKHLAKRDNERTILMNRSNITVIRFRNEEVLNDSKLVIKKNKNVSSTINLPAGNWYREKNLVN